MDIGDTCDPAFSTPPIAKDVAVGTNFEDVDSGDSQKRPIHTRHRHHHSSRSSHYDVPHFATMPTRDERSRGDDYYSIIVGKVARRGEPTSRLRDRPSSSSSSSSSSNAGSEDADRKFARSDKHQIYYSTSNHRAPTMGGDALLLPGPSSYGGGGGSAAADAAEWAPGLITRSLVIGLGYVVGMRAYESATGLGTITSLLLIVIGNEFFSFSLKCTREMMRREREMARVADRDSSIRHDDEYVTELLRIAERIAIIMRYFSFTAVTYAANESFKKLFGDVDESVGIVVVLVFIVVLNEALESMFSHRTVGQIAKNRRWR